MIPSNQTNASKNSNHPQYHQKYCIPENNNTPTVVTTALPIKKIDIAPGDKQRLAKEYLIFIKLSLIKVHQQ